MYRLGALVLVVAGLLVLPVVGAAFGPPEKPDAPAKPADQPAGGADEMAAMMARAKQFTAPGKHHDLLKKFLGKWTTETRLYMGGKASPPETGTAEATWMMDGRWVQSDWKSTFMGMKFRSVTWMGYDNFKQSYVTTTVTNLDTMMVRSEGDLDPGGKVLITYGTMDEYLTGEHDKMVKYVWRFESDDKIVFEVHDLPIGENNTKVFDVVFTRAK